METEIELLKAENELLKKCLKDAMDEFTDRVRAAQKELGGMISWVGPDWYNTAWQIINLKK